MHVCLILLNGVIIQTVAPPMPRTCDGYKIEENESAIVVTIPPKHNFVSSLEVRYSCRHTSFFCFALYWRSFLCLRNNVFATSGIT